MINATDQPSPEGGIKAIEHSLRCLGFGVGSCVPMIGLPIAVVVAANAADPFRGIALGFAGILPLISLPLALLASSNYRKARASGKGQWNPARNHLIWGRIMSAVGILVFLLVLLFIACAFMGLLP